MHSTRPDLRVTVLRSDDDVKAYAEQLSELLRQATDDDGEGGALRVPTPRAIADQQEGLLFDVGAQTGAVTDSALVDTIGPSWSASRLRRELGGVSRQALHQRVKRGTLLGVPTSDGETAYPLFQFRRRNGGIEVRPALQAVIRELRDESAWSVAVLLNTAAPELDGVSPVEWERRGQEPERLAELAVALKRERAHA